MRHKRDQILIALMSLSRLQKKIGLSIIDAIALVIALWSAFALRFSSFWPSNLESFTPLFFITPLVGVAIFAKLGLYRSVLRHIRSNAVQAVILGVGLLSGAVWLLSYLFVPQINHPASVFIIFALSSMLYVSGTRLVLRSYYRWVVDQVVDRERVMIFGAGGAGVQLAKLLESGAEYLPVGFSDDDPSLWGNDVFGLRVYDPRELGEVIKELRVASVLIALPNLSEVARADIAQRLAKYHVSVKTIPSMPEIISGAAIDKLRDIQIEDLLGRRAVEPMSCLVDPSLNQKVVCITGAGGSIGSELTRQVLKGGASKIVLVETSEYALYEIERELQSIRARDNILTIEITPVLISVLLEDGLAALLKEHNVHTVYHAAAYKHVPIVEINPFEGVRNNTLGTLSAARAAVRAGVERFVLISTDKAVRPTNIMGASKRLAEMVLQALSDSDESKNTIFSIVRFGNVLGSSGSVVPLFKQQIESGGPVTVTHPQINRYFMTIREAASLVIQAGTMAEGGEIFVLDMGEPVKILDLAERMIHLSGFDVKSQSNPTGDIEITFTGLRAGEKLFEELLIGGDITGTGHPKILCADEQFLPLNQLSQILSRATEAIESQDMGLLRSLLIECISGYKPAVDLVVGGKNDEHPHGKVVPLRRSTLPR